MNRKTKILLAGLALALPTQLMAQSVNAKATAVVETGIGKVQGLMDGDISTFKGIRYGKPPVGPLRFMPPEKPESWTNVQDATALAAPCMQMYSPGGPRQSDFSTEMQTIFPTGPESRIDNEDCLFLNVWTPAADAKKRPVMVWFHGGGHAYGSGGWPAYDGRNLAAKGDVVVVTVNHRLNAMGYMYLGDKFGSDFAKSGNVGDLDLVASLQWVKDNIAAFGGDASNVTIMGESGGGSKVSHMLAMPTAKGLFHKAAIQSGPGVTSGKKADAAKLTEQVLSALGVTTVEQLRSVPADDIINATRKVMNAGGGYRMGGPNFGPIVDGTVLPRDPFLPAAPEVSKDVPILIGWNKDEMTIFMAAQPWFGALDFPTLDSMAPMFGAKGKPLIEQYRKENPDYSASHIAVRAMGARFIQGTYLLADQKAAQNGAPVYVYQLTYETPVQGGTYKSPHTLDIPFMFNNVDKSRVLVGEGKDAETMGAMMSDAWLAFAKTGVPASPLLPKWEPYNPTTRTVMQLNLKPAMVSDPEKGAREIMAAK